MLTGLPGLFVTGTDTGVGKTFVASAIARALVREGHRVGALKPVATGARRDGESWRCEDAEELRNAIGGGDIPLEWITPRLFEEPLAPTVAARRMGSPLLREELVSAVAGVLRIWENRAEVVVVEGVGGWFCPLAERLSVADLAVLLDYPVVVVGRRGLGTINHTLLTVEAVRVRGLRCVGVLLNGSSPTRDPLAETTNREELTRWLGTTAVLAELGYGEDPSGPMERLGWGDRALPSRGGAVSIFKG